LYSLRYQVFTEEMKKLDCLKGASGNVWKDKEYKCVLFTHLQITTTVILSSYIPLCYRHILNRSQ
jgi:hypothetical protein